MKKTRITSMLLALCSIAPLSAKDYYISPSGNDANAGTKEAPYATLTKALNGIQPGDNIYIGGGTYKVTEDWIMSRELDSNYAAVFNISAKGTESAPIGIYGVEGERPVFDLTDIKLTDRRVTVFYITGHYNYFKNFEVIGTQVRRKEPAKGSSQSEVFRINGGNNNTMENIAVHDGMAIGFYLIKGMNNLVLNCDVYNNYDDYSSDDGRGGNVDGFGGHVNSTSSTGNVFRGCRAWYNSDDGFDLINCFAAVTIENCWSFNNGYKPGTRTAAGDGTGFKSGGYGMADNPKVPNPIPQHIVRHCIAYYNLNKGFYANHHLGGIIFENNSAYQNPSNYCMLNRKSSAEVVDVPGYGHLIKNNLSHSPRSAGKHIIDVNQTECEIVNNSFGPQAVEVADADFESLDPEQLTLPRKADGSLPDITFMKPVDTSVNKLWGMGYFADQVVIDYSWMQEAAIVIEGTTARVAGPGSEAFTKFYVNGQEVEMNNQRVELSSYSGSLELKATTPNGGVATLKIKR